MDGSWWSFGDQETLAGSDTSTCRPIRLVAQAGLWDNFGAGSAGEIGTY